MRLLVAAIGVFALLLTWAECARLRYHGDGRLSGPHLLRPRYTDSFPDVPLDKEGTYDFHFRGIPEEEMTLILYIKGNADLSFDERRSFETLGTTIDASLTDDRGNVACHVSGRPSDGIWVLQGPPEAGYFGLRQCHPVRVYPNRSYDLAIQVRDVEPHGKEVVIAPRLEGGGIELP